MPAAKQTEKKRERRTSYRRFISLLSTVEIGRKLYARPLLNSIMKRMLLMDIWTISLVILLAISPTAGTNSLY